MDAVKLEKVRAARERLGTMVRTTPVWQWQGSELEDVIGDETEVWLKLELFQYTGSFKARGAFNTLLSTLLLPPS